jgi:hypothetical protein
MTDRKVWFITGASSTGRTEHKGADLQAQIGAYRNLSASLALDELQTAGNRR